MNLTEIQERPAKISEIRARTEVAMDQLRDAMNEINSLQARFNALKRERAKPFGAADEAAKKLGSGEL